MLVPMAKVQIIGPKRDFSELLCLLHSIGTLHIEDLSKKIMDGVIPVEQMEVEGDQLIERERLEGLLTRVRAILGAFPSKTGPVDFAERERLYEDHWREDATQLSQDVENLINEVEKDTSSLASRQASIEQELALLTKYEPILHKIQPLAKQIVTVGGFESVALLIERRYKGLLDDLRDELNRITKRQCEIVSTDVDAETTAAIVVFNKRYSDEVHKFLSMENVNQVRLPTDMADQPFDVAYEMIREKRQTLPKELERIKRELSTLSGQWRAKLVAIRDVLADRIDEIGAIPMFGQTEYAFVVTGWVPVKDMAELRKTVGADFGEDIVVEQLEIDEHEFEDTPVALHNPKIIAPYQQLLSVFGPPKYGTLDPTWMLALFYPVFFGMIVGDIGYGLLMMTLAIWLRIKYRENNGVQIATAIFGPAATMAIVFGVLYGEFFGNLLGPHMLNVIREVDVFGVVLPLNREESAAINLLMVATIGVGFFQVCLGLVLGAINGIRTKHMKHAYEKGGLFVFLISIAILVFAIMAKVGGVPLQLLAVAGLLGGAFFAVKGGGVMGGVELIGTISNIASYIRIMAVGLAGAILASVANSFANPEGGSVSVIGIVAAGALHALNILIAAFSPTIHALRLNFLEFFQKFYEAGSQEYSPFHKTGGE